MNPEYWKDVQAVGYIFATVAMVAFGVVFIAIAHSLVGKLSDVRNEMQLLEKENREVRRNMAALGVQILNYDMARRVSVVQNSQYGNPEVAFCPTCKSTTAQEYSPATGKPLTTKCIECGNSRPL
jgi:FlaG/FlaF family flagellin (archaellin)